MATFESFQEVETEDYLNLRGEDDEVNIALVGETGCGRASFVNAIRGIRDDDEDAAKTGKRVGTTSKMPTSYPHPKSSMMNFWILPAFDTKAFPNFNSFFNCVDLEKYDAFLIFTPGFFKEKHLEFALQSKSKNKPFFLIRTKIDNDYRHGNGKEDFEEEEMLNKVRLRLAETLQDLRCSKEDIFLISNHHPCKWDFGRLAKAISDILPSPQTQCLTRILSDNSTSTDDKTSTEDKTSRNDKTSEDGKTSTEDTTSTEDKPSTDKETSTDEETSTDVKKANSSSSGIFQDFIRGLKHDMTLTKVLKNIGEVEKTFWKDGFDGVQKLMGEKLEEWKQIEVTVAIIGNSGVGKSSFINAIRRLKDYDKLAAKVGVKETTLEVAVYPHPTNPKIKFWDLPGIGTPNYPNFETFCEKVQLEKYDTFLILCAGRFTQNDLDLAKKVESMKKPFFFIRTKIDQDKRNERQSKKDFNEKKMLAEIKEDCVKNLENFNFEKAKIFLISSHKRNKWDFNRLEDAILKQLPYKQKETLAFSLKTESKKILKRKVEVLRGRLWKATLASIAGKALGPLSLLIDKRLITKRVKFYTEQLGFPENHSEEFKMMNETLQKKVKTFQFDPKQDDFESWMKEFDPDNNYNIKVTRGVFMATKNPLKFVHLFLKFVLDEMEKTAEAILDEAATRTRGEGDSDTD